MEGRAYAGGWWDWLTPFSLLTGFSLVIGYALLGSCWLIWKTEGELQAMARRFARPLAIALVVAIAIVSAATPFLDAKYYQAWFAWPGVLAAAQMPLLVAIRSEEHTSELQSLMRISYAVFCLQKQKKHT